MSENLDLRKTVGQILRFLAVGSAATVTDLVAYLLLVEAGIPPTFAKALSYIGGTLVGFFGNKFWTFGSARRSIAEPITYGALYTGTLAVNVGMNAAILYLLAEVLSPAWERGIAFVVATGVTTALNFLGLRFLTFGVGFQDFSEPVEVQEMVGVSVPMAPSVGRQVAKAP